MAQHRTRQQKVQAEARRTESTYTLPPQPSTDKSLHTEVFALPRQDTDSKKIISDEQLHYLRQDLFRTASAILAISLSLLLVVIIK